MGVQQDRASACACGLARATRLFADAARSLPFVAWGAAALWLFTAARDPLPPPAVPALDSGSLRALLQANDDRPAQHEQATWTVGDTWWPHRRRVHPVVDTMPASAETSIEVVARTIAAREPDPFQRVKAMHDWVVTRLTYDQASVSGKQRKRQDARSVFRRRSAVCEGYARLLVAMGRVTGDRIVYLTGEVRTDDGAVMAIPHAWNAVEILGHWYILDATWNDPDRGDAIETSYLFTPPSVAILDHYPADPKWQLLDQPISRDEFLRQSVARPGFARYDVHPRASWPVLEARGAVELILDNPSRRRVTLVLAPHGSNDPGRPCATASAATVHLRCPLPTKGRYDARIFTDSRDAGGLGFVGSIGVNSR